MKVTETALKGVFVIEPQVFGDARGWFMESWSQRKFEEAGIRVDFVQDNQSFSAQKGTLRGLHYQLNPMCQAKLLRCTRGEILDVAVDIRRGSPTYGQHVKVELSADNGQQFWVPPGFAHGFCVLSEEADFFYKCTDYYHPPSERGIAWNDPEIGIDWPLRDVSLSGKDQQNRQLSTQADEDLPVYER